MSLAVIVCQNGLGHFRRVTQIVSALLPDAAGRPITLFCGEWQCERMRGDTVVDTVLAGCQIVPIDDHPTRLLPAAQKYAVGALTECAVALLDTEPVRNSDIVWSDNLSAVLELRPDALLSGSFLWSEVLATRTDDDEAQRFVVAERARLSRLRPPMIGVDALALPALRARTDFVGVPPMTAERPWAPQAASLVAVMPGATGLLDEALASATEMTREAFALVAPKKWARQGDVVLDFAPEQFAMLQAAVIRPGLGAIHDCLASGVPMVAVREPGNAELEHNAERVAALGLGIAVDAHPSAIIQGLHTVIAKRAEIREAIKKLGGGGVKAAADYIKAQWSGVETPKKDTT